MVLSSRDGSSSCKDAVVAATVVSYRLDEDTTMAFEIEPVPGFRPAGANEIAGRIREAVDPGPGRGARRAGARTRGLTGDPLQDR